MSDTRRTEELDGWASVGAQASTSLLRCGALDQSEASLVWTGKEIVAADGAVIACDYYHEFRVTSLVDRLPADELIPFWRELFRVCRHAAVVCVSGAYWTHVDVCADPTRRRGLSERMFMYLSEAGRAVISSDPCDDALATKQLAGIDFHMTKIVRITENEWDTRSADAKEWGLRHYFNVARRIEFVLAVCKKPA